MTKKTKLSTRKTNTVITPYHLNIQSKPTKNYGYYTVHFKYPIKKSD